VYVTQTAGALGAGGAAAVVTRVGTASPQFGARRTLAVYLLLAAIVLTPVFAVNVWGLGDTPNHLARIHILTRIADTPALQLLYETSWKPVPYLGMDVVVASLSLAMPIYLAGRVFVALCLLTPVAAAALLRRVVWGRVGLMPALGFLLSYNYLIARGFLAYVFGAGLAVMLFAGWLATERSPPWRRAALFAPAALLLYFCHAFAFLTYGLLVGGYELGSAARQHFQPPRKIFMDWLAAVAQAIPVAATVVLFAASTTAGFKLVTVYGSLSNKLAAVAAPLFFPGPPAVVGLFVLLPLIAMAAARQLRLAPALWPTALLVGVVAAATPNVLLSSWGADYRLPYVVGIVMIAAAAPRRTPGRVAAWAGLAILVAFVAARSANAFSLLRQLDAEEAQIRSVVQALPEGARLLVVDAGRPQAGPFAAPAHLAGHLAMVATIDRNAFIPFLFTGTTAVQPRPEWRTAASPSSLPIDLDQFKEGMLYGDPPSGPPPYGYGGQQYWLGWPRKFSFVLVECYGRHDIPLPAFLHRLAHSEIADLYEVDQP
jgi:hypothetical protein